MMMNMMNTGYMSMTVEILNEENPFLVPLDTEEYKVEIQTIIKDMRLFTENLVVNSEASYRKMTSIYAQAREWKKSIDAKRKSLTEPLRKQASIINDKAKELTDPLDNVINMANAKANGYLRMLEEIKRQEDEKLREAAALFDSAEELYIPPMEKIIRGDGAVTVTKIEKRFKVLDITKVPTKYLVVDEDAIKKDLKLGIQEIPGLEIWEETTTQLRIR